jgi:hypothetical protein
MQGRMGRICMTTHKHPGKLYCEKCGKEISEGHTIVEDNRGYSHWKCKHPALYRKLKSWKK